MPYRDALSSLWLLGPNTTVDSGPRSDAAVIYEHTYRRRDGIAAVPFALLRL